MKNLVYCVIPNWNGKDSIGKAIKSLEHQSHPCHIVVVENGSVDGSIEFIERVFPNVTLLKQARNQGFAEGVNIGIRFAIAQGATYVALLNNDATAKKDWLEQLVAALDKYSVAGTSTGKLVDSSKTNLDSTGEFYTTWGLPYPRGRGEPVSDKYDKQNWVFGASGGASLYRIRMLQQVGLFDKDFFAYYEDSDLSFRAQLAGWKTYYEPKAIAYHQIGATSSRIKGFTTYQTMKNLPVVFWKNVPWNLVPIIFPRLLFAYWTFMFSAFTRSQGWPAIKGHLAALWLLPKKLIERHRIQKNRVVSNEHLRSVLTWNLPPNATKLRRLRRRK